MPEIRSGDLVRVDLGDGETFHAIAADVEMSDEGGSFTLIVDPENEDDPVDDV